MLSINGFTSRFFNAIALIILLFLSRRTDCQVGILDSAFTFGAGIVKTGNALDIITKKTGFNFTYDSRLIDEEKRTVMNFSNVKLSVILDSILVNDSLTFTLIDKYIIISRPEIADEQTTNSSESKKADYITGYIADDETNEPLSFASIGLKNKGRGTVSNNNGEFGLKITSDIINDTLYISYLGYISREIPVNEIQVNNITISMKREFISIPEIIIKNQIPQEIIYKTLLSINQNYSTIPVYLTGFYREGVLKKRVLQNYSEAILKIYKTSYSGSLLSDQMKIYKSRKMENVNLTDTLAVRLKAGLKTCLELDGAKNTFDFLSSESMPEYTYRLTDIVTYDDESAYVIDFVQRADIDLPLYKGTIYINTTDYAILSAEFELNQSLIHKMKGSFITNTTHGFETWPVSVKYSVSYRKVNKIYYLNHVRGDLLFTSRQRKKLFSSQFSVFFELAITDIDLNNVKRFDREELAPIHSIFSKVKFQYDPLFWGNQDFLRPEDNLLKALQNIDINLQEFSEQIP